MAQRDRIGEILLAAKVLDQLQLRSVKHHQAQWGGRTSRAAIELGLAEPDAVATAVSAALRMPLHPLGRVPRDPVALSKLDEEFCSRHGVLPLAYKEHGRQLVLAMADPTDLATVDEASQRSGCRVSTVLVADLELEQAIPRLYRGVESAPVPTRRARVAVERASMQERGLTGGLQELELDMTAPPSPNRGARAGFTDEQKKRLADLAANQLKSARVVQVLADLLTAKGLLK